VGLVCGSSLGATDGIEVSAAHPFQLSEHPGVAEVEPDKASLPTK
jgi:hypothetical protein